MAEYTFEDSYQTTIEVDRGQVPGANELTDEQWQHVCQLADKDQSFTDAICVALALALGKFVKRYAMQAQAEADAEAMRLIAGGLTGDGGSEIH